MGNKLGRRRQVVDEKFTRPQGLYQHKDVDHKKLRKLILDSKLAPCYPGEDECVSNSELEECPICFLYYPSLNRSRCCMKGICTECFLQMKTPNSTLPTQCPFCKTLNYAVEYRGVKTKEEKGIEQIEEQLVIEAKIRMRKQELQEEEERMLRQKEVCSSSSITGPSEMEHCSTTAPLATAIEGSEVVTSQETCSAPATRQALWSRQIRDDEFDLDLEDIMIMEAIWLSIQENGKPQTPGYRVLAPPEQYVSHDNHASSMASAGGSSSSPSGGLACAIAALAERQQMGKESSSSYSGGVSSSYNHHSACSRSPDRAVQEENEDYPQSEMPMDGEDREWADNGSSRGEAGTGYAASDDVGQDPPRGETERDGFQPVSGPIVPESFEEQMMLAMAVSLADSQARTNAPEAWH
ncbi:PREDICTED: uncharacterized protein LOC109156050 isoform X2 [Ipomoea nil]|uniref:uncharacterized protein LOC109156050 isoform X2 n=1 Tax=Ipomoea nil TaxID=35883 RepID=UPI000900A78B|nr:PREDICTED: uncharacterized protein LOC109156050 isoform X2 [Ipomoea nil]